MGAFGLAGISLPFVPRVHHSHCLLVAYNQVKIENVSITVRFN